MRRCICGHSSQFPICDGQHQQKGWGCTTSPQKQLKMGIIAGENYFSLAEKLASHLKAQVVGFSSDACLYQTILILSDGTDLEEISSRVAHIQYKEARIITIGIPASFLASSFPNTRSVAQISANMRDLWVELLAAISTKITKRQDPTMTKIFISHSTKDGEFLSPVINYLRQYFGLEIFLCSDSILGGELWYPKIISALENTDAVFAIHSQNFTSSHFCSFEMGAARALQKRVLIIALDDTPLPVFLQDIQADFLSIHQSKKSWLSPQESLIDIIMNKI